MQLGPGWIDLGGTIRAVPPAETRARVVPHLARIGITRVAHITGLDRLGIPVSVAVRPTSRLLSTAQGKGTTQELADLSAILESVETWHAENLPPPDAVASFRSLVGRAGARPVDPARLRQPPQLRRRFDPDEPIGWMTALELGTGQEVLLPAACFDLDTCRPASCEHGLTFLVTTTGLASGNTWTEAVLHGLYEAIERDAHHRYDRLPPAERAARQMDLDSIDCPQVRSLLERIEQAGLEIEIADISSSIRVPAFRACLIERGVAGQSFCCDEGMGAHLRPEVALLRAITEAAQSRLAYISGSRDDLFPDAYRLGASGPEPAPLGPARGRRTLAECPRPVLGPTLEDHLAEVLRLLGVPAYVCDHTRPDIGLPVVHVLCPELHDRAGC